MSPLRWSLRKLIVQKFLQHALFVPTLVCKSALNLSWLSVRCSAWDIQGGLLCSHLCVSFNFVGIHVLQGFGLQTVGSDHQNMTGRHVIPPMRAVWLRSGSDVMEVVGHHVGP